MKFFKISICIIGIFLISTNIAFSNSFKNGLEAAKLGDFETAIEIFLPLAETSDAPSQEMLGLIFELLKQSPHWLEKLRMCMIWAGFMAGGFWLFERI